MKKVSALGKGLSALLPVQALVAGQEFYAGFAPDRRHEEPSPPREKPDRAHEAPGWQHEAPARPHEAPGWQHEGPDRRHGELNPPHEKPDQAHEDPDWQHEGSDQAHEDPDWQHEDPDRAHEDPDPGERRSPGRRRTDGAAGGRHRLQPTDGAQDGGGMAGRDAVEEIAIDLVEPNPSQPRKAFDGDALEQLAASIRSVGVVQPIIVSDEGVFYRIIAGERRWRAAKLAGLPAIPAIVRGASDERRLEIALVENLQRQDLNPIEEAMGYERLMSSHAYTQERLASAVGKSRPAIANTLRLLRLSKHVRGLIESGRLSAGHARALLAVEPEACQDLLADAIVEQELSVRHAENLAGDEAYLRKLAAQAARAALPEAAPAAGAGAGAGAAGPGKGAGGATGAAAEAAVIRSVEETLMRRFGTKVALAPKGRVGRIVIEYYGADDLQRLLEIMGVTGL